MGFFTRKKIFKNCDYRDIIRRDYSLDDAESGFSSWTDTLGPSSSALPAVPGPPPPSAGLTSHEVTAAALSARAAASAVPSSSLVASSAPVGSPRTVAGGVAEVGVVAPLGAVPGRTGRADRGDWRDRSGRIGQRGRLCCSLPCQSPVSPEMRKRTLTTRFSSVSGSGHCCRTPQPSQSSSGPSSSRCAV